MRQIDEQYMKVPFYGRRRMTQWLRQDRGILVNEKRVGRLMNIMGIEAIYPKRRAKAKKSEHKIYPYLLRDVTVAGPNHVWSADITYIPIRGGTMYLVAIIDWHSRYVLSWAISNTQDVDFCLEALESAMNLGKPEIFNTDQGTQFTSHAFTGRLNEADVKISMDGRGRAFDNIFIERLWRTVKNENVYLEDYADGYALYHGLEAYFEFYNTRRRHQSLGYLTPEMVYHGSGLGAQSSNAETTQNPDPEILLKKVQFWS